MSGNKETVYVVGAPGLSAALVESGSFVAVVDIPTTAVLKDKIAKKELSGDSKTAFFVFSDTATNDTPGFDLPTLVAALASRQWKVAVLANGGSATQIVEKAPSAGLVNAPFTTNGIIGALSTFAGRLLDPVQSEWAFQPLVIDSVDAVAIAKAAVSAPAPEVTADVSASKDANTDWASADTTPEPAESAVPEPAEEPKDAFEALGSWTIEFPSETASPAPEPAAEVADSPAEASSWVKAFNSGETFEASADPAPVADEVEDTPPASSWSSDPVPTPSFEAFSPAPAPAASEPAPAPVPEPASEDFGFSAETFFSAPSSSEGDSGPQIGDHAYWSKDADSAVAAAGHGRVIAVTVAKGGAGKSTLTTNLGVFAANLLRSSGKSVCVVDANWQQADIGNLIGAWSPTIRDLSTRPADIAVDRIEKYVIGSDEDLASNHRPFLGHCHFLLSPSTVNEASPTFITPSLFRNVVRTLRGIYDYVILDTPVAEFHHSLFTEFILPEADFFLIPVNPDNATVVNAYKWLEEITKDKLMGGCGVSEDNVGYVINRASENVGYSVDEVRADMQHFHYLGPIAQDDSWQQAANNGELMALANNVEVNYAFSKILYKLTGEPVFKALIDRAEANAQNAGRGKRRRGFFGR